MKKFKGFLLLELLTGAVVICITGGVLSRSFSREIDVSSVSSEYETAIVQINSILFQAELAIKQIDNEDDLLKYSGAGTLSDPRFTWKVAVKPHSGMKNLYLINIDVSGIRGGRELNFIKYINLRFSEESVEKNEEEQEK
ncbi:MAG: hypothetical protein ACD_79C00925G0004 [uncultured bacterium]|nr:MAG: hypothetical protein ACD_79C00925G0004 [uncultured bacterium]